MDGREKVEGERGLRDGQAIIVGNQHLLLLQRAVPLLTHP